MGRHTVRRLLTARQAAGFVLVIASLGILGIGVARYGFGVGQESATASSASPSPGASCGTRPVTVVVAPEIAQVVTTRLAAVTTAQPCQRYTVTPVPSHLAAARIAQGQAPDVWVPDSKTWTDRLGAQSSTWSSSGSLATTPVVIAAPLTGAGALTTPPASWTVFFNTLDGTRVSNPDQDSASRLAYFASRVGQPPKLDLLVGARLIFASRFASASVGDLLKGVAEGGEIGPFPVTEHDLAAFDTAHPGLLTRVVPKAGTPILDYPFLVSAATPADLSAATRTAYESLTSTDGAAAFGAAGFRSTERAGGPAIGGQPAPSVVVAVPLATAAERSQAVEQWNVLRKDMRLLVAIDVSGSMLLPAKGANMTRAQVTVAASQDALKVIPGGSKIGLWIFSTNKGGPKVDYKQLSDIQVLDSPAPTGKGSYRQYLTTVTTKLKTYMGGDTGLYDTAYAAYLKVRNSYDAAYVNSVVLMTDGTNDDPGGGLSLSQLLTKLKAAEDPKRPVRIVTIGMGEADPRALKAISAATGGTSYIANTPADIERVFVEALLARSTKAGVRL